RQVPDTPGAERPDAFEGMAEADPPRVRDDDILAVTLGEGGRALLAPALHLGPDGSEPEDDRDEARARRDASEQDSPRRTDSWDGPSMVHVDPRCPRDRPGHPDAPPASGRVC